MLLSAGARAMSKNLSVDEDEAKRIMQSFFSKFPNIKRFKDETVEAARRQVTCLDYRQFCSFYPLFLQFS